MAEPLRHVCPKVCFQENCREVIDDVRTHSRQVAFPNVSDGHLSFAWEGRGGQVRCEGRDHGLALNRRSHEHCFDGRYNVQANELRPRLEEFSLCRKSRVSAEISVLFQADELL